MYPKGLIYQSGRSKAFGEIKLSPSFGVRLVYHLFRGVGAGLLSFAVVGIIFSFWPIAREEFLYKFGTKEEIKVNKFAQIIGKSLASELGLDPYFSIYIPKINAKARVIPNVDAGAPSDYLEALESGVAHAKGTNFPGQGHSIFLFSHSTDSPINIARYNAVFYLLGKLEEGDTITIFFLKEEHKYVVEEKVIAEAGDTTWLADDGSGERLILQTCSPPGTTWKRLLIVARPI